MKVLRECGWWLVLFVSVALLTSGPVWADEGGRSDDGPTGVVSEKVRSWPGQMFPDDPGLQAQGGPQQEEGAPEQEEDAHESESGSGSGAPKEEDAGEDAESAGGDEERDPSRREDAGTRLGAASPGARGLPDDAGIPGLPEGDAPGVPPSLCGSVLAGYAQECADGSEEGEEGSPSISRDGPGPQEDPPSPGSDSGSDDVQASGARVWAWGAGITLSALLLAVLYRVWAFLFLGASWLPAGWRLDRRRVMEHPVRKAILEHLEDHPGATVQELAEKAEVHNNRAVYHLSILEREELVSQRRVEGRKHFFLRSAPPVDPDRLKKRTLTRSDRSPGRILEHLSRNAGATVSQIARSLGFSPGHAHYHLTRLAEENLLVRTRRGRRVRHYLTEEAQRWLPGSVQARETGPAWGSTTGGVSA